VLGSRSGTEKEGIRHGGLLFDARSICALDALVSHEVALRQNLNVSRYIVQIEVKEPA
jgi:hypothetical protein